MNRRPLCAVLILLVVGFAIPASCQVEPIITDFRPWTSFTWTNRQANTHCDIEWVCNLEHEWVPCGLNLQATQAVTSIDVDALNAFQALIEQLQWLYRNAPDGTYVGNFLRVACSENPIEPRPFTNALRVVNVSTSVLTSVTMGLKQGGASVPLTNFPELIQMATTDVVRVWSPYPTPPPTIVLPIGEVQDGWYVAYGHDGSNHVFQLEIMPFGPVEKNILLTVSNNSATVELEWLRLTQTRSY